MKRAFDLLLGLLAGVLLLPPMVLVALAVRFTSPGPVSYLSDRVGKDNRIFRMPKFCSMRVGTPAVASHLLSDPKAHLTPIGSFLRKSSLDELPQLLSILEGCETLMSVVHTPRGRGTAQWGSGIIESTRSDNRLG